MKGKFLLTLLVAVLGLSLVLPGCGPQEEKKVIFATGAWTGDWLTIYPIKILLEEEFDYTTEIADTSVPAAWTAIGTGSADLWTNSWQPNQEELKNKYAGTTDSLGVIYGDCINAWLIPTYTSEEYGITSVEDLNDPEIARLFDVDSDGKGDLLGCDAAWKCAEINDEMLAGYGLDGLYEQKYGVESMMMAAIEGRMRQQEPVLFYLYTPHPFFVRYPIGESVIVLEDPKGFWGETVDVYKFGNSEWVEAHPQAAELVRQVEMEPADIGWSMGEIETRGDDAETLEAIAREWMAQHQSEIDAWVAAAKAK